MENPKAFLLAALFSLAPLAAGCSALRLELVDASVEKPSNVAVYFTVDTRQGEPVPGLTADQFNIYEDGRLVSTHESRQTILNPEVAAVRYTLLLLDMSGSVVEAGQVPLIQEAVGAFLQNVDEKEKVAIYALRSAGQVRRLGSRAPPCTRSRGEPLEAPPDFVVGSGSLHWLSQRFAHGASRPPPPPRSSPAGRKPAVPSSRPPVDRAPPATP